MAVKPLTGKQLQAYQLSDRRLNVYEGSVRSSKTITSLVRWLIFVRQGPRGNLLMLGRTERTLKRNIIDPLIQMLGSHRCRHVSGAGELWICGRRIYLASATDERAADKIAGLSLVGAYGDEIGRWPESVWTMLLSRLSEPGAQLFGTSNPEGPAHWLKTGYLDRAALWVDRDGNTLKDDSPGALDLARFSFKLADNPHLPPEYIESLNREYTGLWRRRLIDGEWCVSEGAIYDMWDPDLHVIDVLPPIQRWLCSAVDYGQAHPFHAVLLGLGTDNVLYVVSEWRHEPLKVMRQYTDVEYSQHVRAWLQQVPIPGTRRPDGTWLRGVTPEYMVVDPAAASFRVQLHRDGLQPALADNAVLDGIRLVSSLLHAGKLKVSSACPGLIAEVPGYSWDPKAAKRGEDAPIKLGDDGCDALRYACNTTRAIWQQYIPLVFAEPADEWAAA